MGIFLIILGGLALIIGLVLFVPTRKALSSDAEWDDFYKYYLNNAGPDVPEDVLYNLVSKLYKASIILLCIALVGLTGGIILQITIK